MTLKVALPAGWRAKSDISRRVGTWSMRAMTLGGMTLLDLEDGLRQERGLGAAALALRVKGMGQFGKHAGAKKAGVLKDDIIVGIDGHTTRTSEGELIGRLLESRKAGESVELIVLRGKERVAIRLPMQ